MKIDFPESFPTIERMEKILQKTIEKSWKTDIEKQDIQHWLSNFHGKVYNSDDEQRLALWLLCNFTYYSYEDVTHLCKYLYRVFLHDYVITNKLNPNNLRNSISNLFFTSIGNASESGGLLLYHFRQEAKLSLDRFFYPTSIQSTDNDTLVLIDDVSISGGTALRTFYNLKLNDKPNKNIYYLTIIASETAVEKLSALGIKVIYCSLIDERNQCFSNQSIIFNKFEFLKEPTKTMVEEYGQEIVSAKVKPLGYKNGAYNFGFYYNIPNNTLPIYWSTQNWNPIFPRKEKLQNEHEFQLPKGKFI